MSFFAGLVLTLAFFASLNAAVLYGLLKLHPRRRRWIWGVAILGNAFWLFVPLIFESRTTPFVRGLRAVLAPPWFSWAMFLFLYAAVLLLIAAAALVLRRPFAETGRIPSAVFLSTLGVLALLGWYDAIVPLRIERPVVSVPEQSATGTRIAVISDLHVGTFTRTSRLRAISEAVNQERPDALVLTGDLIDDDPHFVPKLLEGLDHIDPSIPILAVLGNHEIYGDPHVVIEMLSKSRVDLLVNEGRALTRNGSTLWFAGVSDEAASQERSGAIDLRPDLDRSLSGRPAGAFTVLISHQPEIFEEAIRRGIPLTLAGHTHGGQFGSRSLGWSLAGLFLRWHMGAYAVGNSHLYVNTGTGYWVVPFRLGMTPEITILTIR